MTFEALQTLLKELDEYRTSGLVAQLWWRDDNATEPTVELDRLIAMSNKHDVACGLAAIPAGAGESLRKAVSDAAHVWILQHGFAHADYADHASGGDDAWELGLHRPRSVVLDELRDGMLKFNQLFKSRFVPVLVPPWDHIDSGLLPYLPVMGFRGLSASSREQRSVPPEDLRQVDVHCDVLDKSGGKAAFAGSAACADALVAHLRAKRTGLADDTEPTGIRTLHLEMNDECWAFVEALFAATVNHPAVQWMSPTQIWTAPE